MIERVWVDTSFLYALFVESDQYHRSASDVWRICTDERLPLVSSNLVVAEFGTLLAYHCGHGIAYSRVSLLLDTAFIRFAYADRQAERGAVLWWKRFTDQRFSMVDCVSFEFMRLLGMNRALSYDTDFAVAGYTTVREASQLR